MKDKIFLVIIGVLLISLPILCNIPMNPRGFLHTGVISDYSFSEGNKTLVFDDNYNVTISKLDTLLIQNEIQSPVDIPRDGIVYDLFLLDEEIGFYLLRPHNMTIGRSSKEYINQ